MLTPALTNLGTNLEGLFNFLAEENEKFFAKENEKPPSSLNSTVAIGLLLLHPSVMKSAENRLPFKQLHHFVPISFKGIAKQLKNFKPFSYLANYRFSQVAFAYLTVSSLIEFKNSLKELYEIQQNIARLNIVKRELGTINGSIILRKARLRQVEIGQKGLNDNLTNALEKISSLEKYLTSKLNNTKINAILRISQVAAGMTGLSASAVNAPFMLLVGSVTSLLLSQIATIKINADYSTERSNHTSYVETQQEFAKAVPKVLEPIENQRSGEIARRIWFIAQMSTFPRIREERGIV